MSGIIGAIGNGLGLAKAIVSKSSKKDDKELLKEYVEAEKKRLDAERAVELELEKEVDDQLDNVIEHFEKAEKYHEKVANLLFDAARKEYERLIESKK